MEKKMKKFKKSILTGIILLIQAAALSSCSDAEVTNIDHNDINDTKHSWENNDGSYNTFDAANSKEVIKAKEYLQTKYPSDSFQAATSVNLTNLEFNSSQYAGKVVHVTNSGDGNYTDNYAAVKYADDVQKLFTDVAEKVYGDCRVVYEVNIASVDDSISYADYIADEKSRIRFSVFLKPGTSEDNREALADQLYSELKSDNLICRASVYYTKTDEEYNTEDTNINSLLWKSYAADIKLANGGELKELKWNDPQ